MPETPPTAPMTNTLGDYMNPKAILASGAAGALVMTFTNTLAPVIGVHPALVALAMSCLLAVGSMMVNDALNNTQRFAYFPLVALVIFQGSVGTNSLAVVATSPAPPGKVQVEPIVPGGTKPDGQTWLGPAKVWATGDADLSLWDCFEVSSAHAADQSGAPPVPQPAGTPESTPGSGAGGIKPWFPPSQPR